MGDWNAVLAKLEVQEGPVRPVAKTTLRRYEKQIGMRLPQSYKDYCDAIGPGYLTIPHYYCICVPNASQGFDIADLNQKKKGMADIDLYAKNASQFRRALYFAFDIATSHFFWDAEDVTDDKQSEYGIYVIYRNWQVERLCDTFWSFVNDICLGTGIPAYDNTGGMELVFSPGK